MSATKNPLLNRLHSAPGLSPSQRQIADCLIANMNEAALWGVEELAAKSNTCVATVVRFAKKLDYTGYLEMRKSLVSAAKKQYGRDEQLLQARPLFFREFNSSRMCHVAPQYQVRRCGI